MLRTTTEEPAASRFSAGGALVYGGRAAAEAEVEASNADKRNQTDSKVNLADVAERDIF
jgi:hypothetical protein